MTAPLPLAHADPIDSAADLRLAIFADADGGSLHVHWLRPLAAMRAEGRCALAVATENALARLSPGEAGERIARLVDTLQPHAIVLSRCGGAYVPAIVAAARARGTPIIGHLDDNLFDLPRSIGEQAWQRLMAPERLERLRLGLDASALIWVSTAELAAQLAPVGLASPLRVAPIPAGAAVEEFGPRAASHAAPVIGYIAGATHEADLALIGDALARLLDAHPEASLAIWGEAALPPALARHEARIAGTPYVRPYAAYYEALPSLGWDIGIAPLCDTPHNRAKTCAKWIDYTIAGIPMIGSDLAPYRTIGDSGGALLAADDGWFEALESLVMRPERRDALVTNARALATRDYSLDAMRDALLAMIGEVGR